MVAGRVQSYTGVDFSSDFIVAAQAHQSASGITGARFVCADILDFCTDNPATFDVAFAMDFSEHVYDETWVTAVTSHENQSETGWAVVFAYSQCQFFGVNESTEFYRQAVS